jgi:HK97 family phage portal protein
MSLLSSITRGALGIRADVSGTPAPWDDYWYNPLGTASASGMRITAESAKRVATVLACVNIIGRNIGMMPIKIYTEAPDGSKRAVDHHPLYDVLYQRPNSQQTAFEFKQMMQGHLELRGNAYAEIKEGPRGPVDQLIPMHPDRVTVERLIPSGKLRYVYNDPLTATTRKLMEGEVFHLRNFSDEGAVGQSTIGMACDTFGLALAQQDYAARYMKNDARPPLVLEGTDSKSKYNQKELRESWQKDQTGSNRGKVAILPPGVSVKAIGVTPADQQLLEARKYSRIEIASIFPVPPHMIGETEKTATYASVEQFNIFYVVHCILPRVVLWEQAIQRDLLTSDKYFSKFSLAALLRGDTAARYAAYHIAIGDGWMCQDEARAFEDLNPIPGGIGRRFWRPVNWAPLDQVDAPAALPAQTAETASDDPGSGQGDGDGGEGGAQDSAAQAVRLQLKALAAGVADRCVRKEVAALRKMVDRGASDYDVEEFYAGQRDFVQQAFNIDGDRMLPLRQVYFERAGQVAAFLAAGDKAGAYNFIDLLAVKEQMRLAGIVTGGVE